MKKDVKISWRVFELSSIPFDYELQKVVKLELILLVVLFCHKENEKQANLLRGASHTVSLRYISDTDNLSAWFKRPNYMPQ